MKKNNFLLLLFFFIILSSCGKTSTSQTEENNIDSLNNQSHLTTQTDSENDKIAFEIFSDSGTVELVKGEQGSPIASFKEEILVVTQVPSQTNLEQIQAILQKKQNYSGEAKQALAKKKQEYFEGYIEFYSEETLGMSAEWDSNKEVDVIYNDNYFTTISFMTDEYSGGAHPNGYISYLVLDLKNSKEITLEDIFDANGINTIKQKILDKSLEIAKKEGATTLEEGGFFVEDIKPTENFIVSSTGIEFVYNRSEITPYVMPAPTYFFSWLELKEIIKQDSPLRSLMQ